MPNHIASGHIEWGSVAQYLSAIGTILACIVAIFGPRIRQFLFPPLLELTTLNLIGLDSIVHKGSDVIITRWYHLKLINRQSISPVSGVRVYLLSVKRIRGGEYDIWEEALPMNFRHEKSYELGNVRQIGAEVHVDLFSVKPEQGLKLATAFRSSHGSSMPFSGPVHLQIELQARGVEGNSNILKLDIQWDGEWTENRETMAKHIRVSTMEPIRPKK